MNLASIQPPGLCTWGGPSRATPRLCGEGREPRGWGPHRGVQSRWGRGVAGDNRAPHPPGQAPVRGGCQVLRERWGLGWGGVRKRVGVPERGAAQVFISLPIPGGGPDRAQRWPNACGASGPCMNSEWGTGWTGPPALFRGDQRQGPRSSQHSRVGEALCPAPCRRPLRTRTPISVLAKSAPHALSTSFGGVRGERA